MKRKGKNNHKLKKENFFQNEMLRHLDKDISLYILLIVIIITWREVADVMLLVQHNNWHKVMEARL